MNRLDRIKFNDPFEPPFGYLSPDYTCPIVIEGERFPQGVREYYAMVELAADQEPLWFQSPPMADHAKAMFSDEHGLVVDQMRDHIMYQANICKFAQNRDLGDSLLGTGDVKLVYTNQDEYWGHGTAGYGLNKMGRMLMLIRSSLQRLQDASDDGSK